MVMHESLDSNMGWIGKLLNGGDAKNKSEPAPVIAAAPEIAPAPMPITEIDALR